MAASSCFRDGKDECITRFAPSPTGYLHLGHAASALTARRLAHDSRGRFLLRIEDIDPVRCRPDYADAIIEDLAWIGIESEGPVRRQSAHLPDYRRVLDALSARGLLYPCFCTRAEIAREAQEAAHAPHRAPDGTLAYAGTCRALSPQQRVERMQGGRPYVLRLDMARALRVTGGDIVTWHERGQGLQTGRPGLFGDVVLARKDIPASYHLCVTHDDAAQGVTLVSRGEDLRPATSIHRLLQVLMGWPEPEYAHHTLLLDEAGRRLAKRDSALTLRAMRAAGMTPDAVRDAALGRHAPVP
ncbi:tRNA glutamyl-Q(34) synthetase GluQRS [Gluconacetobacter tumulisoli]|uniref:tRNA glutamyl-Q(34) synthetase GluQRS n=1 Tax=Gluconacetobacter tumulisoli TaxID=1286189 RepID=A0A7W4K9D5_9PROT|nr:tRNA glutamyl-Q(34) synthetase GluQRS [Gluconacetobacter tumulisoli]MBB2202759.1 tRNA glutamyl-Q(34) synthetase GluQRS [Gluconacetobacter tumulisoli]